MGTRNSYESLVDVIIKKKEKEKQLVTRNDYIEWLYNFTKEHTSFSGETYLYDQTGVLEEDLAKIEQLSSFFSGIDCYHRLNLINGKTEGYSREYNIKYKDMYILIGLVVGQGAICYVERLKEEPKNYTLFEDIMNNKEDKMYKAKKENLDKLENILQELKDMDVEISAVENAVNKVFNT